MTREDLLALHGFVRMRVVCNGVAAAAVYVDGATCLDVARDFAFYALDDGAIVALDDLDSGVGWFGFI